MILQKKTIDEILSGSTTTRSTERAGKCLSIILVGFQDQDNLGLRYLMSAVQNCGHHVEIVTYSSTPDELISRARNLQPDIIGFSLIFQYMLPDFARVFAALSKSGIRAHLTIGGHYASFEYAKVLNLIPQLDSVVRYEGECTLVELANHIATGKDWRVIDGLAYRYPNGDTYSNPLRKQIEELDDLPLPNRDSIKYESQKIATASLLGSRGCTWNCSFCSIRPFYEKQIVDKNGHLRRLRNPQKVIKEIEILVKERGVRVFLFQDDDFLATGNRGRLWAKEIVNSIQQSGLNRKIAFKISCRSDEIQYDTMASLKSGGLCHVYMGVESGDPSSLKRMNKNIVADTHLKAGKVLRELGLSYDFGFMLLDPYSNFDEIHNNLNFLSEFVGDGWSVASFCRMLPYAGTQFEQKLRSEGRLLGSHYAPDYNFVEPRLDIFYDWMLETFYERNFTNTGLCNILRVLSFEARLEIPEVAPVFTERQRKRTQELISSCNRTAIETLRQAAEFAATVPIKKLTADADYLRKLNVEEKAFEQRLLLQVNDLRRNVSSNGNGYAKERHMNFIHAEEPLVAVNKVCHEL